MLSTRQIAIKWTSVDKTNYASMTSQRPEGNKSYPNLTKPILSQTVQCKHRFHHIWRQWMECSKNIPLQLHTVFAKEFKEKFCLNDK